VLAPPTPQAQSRNCERSEAIHLAFNADKKMDCFAMLAMTTILNKQ
jgi:hypothetical protein